MAKQEDFKNQALALLLRDRGVDCDYEERRGRYRLDVVAYVDGLMVVIEAETGFHKRTQAIKDADARLNQRLTIAAIALCYPDNATQENLGDVPLQWTLRTKAGDPDAQWSTGSVVELVQTLRQVPNVLDDADVAAKLLSDGLDLMVQRLRIPTRRTLARVLDLPQAKKKDGTRNNGWFVPAKRGMLVVATAMLFHHRVQEHLPVLRPYGYEGPWPPENPEVCAESDAPIHAFREAWRGILAVDYRPVFATGGAALNALSSNPDTALAVSSLAYTVAQISQRVAGLRHDLLGRIFHRVLDTARYDGSYYTSTAAAVLLASLALREEDADWSDPNAVARIRICDPACGTGTLLMTAAERIRDLRMAADNIDSEDDEVLGLELVENILWGYDKNLTATHLAASALGMLSPKTSFSRMNIHLARLGVQEGKAHLGSLDFLAGKPQLDMWTTSRTQQVESGDTNGDDPPPMDLVIMNPPFTRDSLRHDQFSREEEMAIKQREKEIFADKPHHLSGNSGGFLILGEHLNRKDCGAIAVVLPLVSATDKSGLQLRKFLAECYHVETIVSSHDPMRIYFSENTSIGEILLVCRRWNGPGPKPPTNVVNLAENPSTALDALDTARRIQQAIHRGGPGPSDFFTLQQVEEARIRKGDWAAVNFLSPFLVQAHRSLNEDNLACVRMVPLSTIAAIGPAGQRIRDAYSRSRMPTLSGRRALWRHESDVARAMQMETDFYIEPKESKRHLADRYWGQRGRLLLTTRLRLNLSRVVSVMLSESTLGSAWTPCRPHQPEIADAICLYLNSTAGILSLLGDRDNRIPSYPSFSLDTLRSLLAPDFSAMNSDSLTLLRECFQRLKKQTLLSFPKMNLDPVRREIDECVAAAIGLDKAWLESVRNSLCREPALTASSLAS